MASFPDFLAVQNARHLFLGRKDDAFGHFLHVSNGIKREVAGASISHSLAETTCLIPAIGFALSWD